MKTLKRSTCGAFLAAMACCSITLAAPTSRPGLSARRGGSQAPPPQSRIIVDGDVEILTFESEEDYRKLQTLYEECQKNPPKPGTYSVQYFRSAMDRSVQPYGLWLPADYTPDKPCALAVQLHGISRSDGASGRRITYTGMVVHDWIDPHTPVIQVQPLARTNNSYSVMGEQDVLEVIKEVKSHFNVDSERIFLMGHSMGGAGTMSIGLHYPSVFGALTPIDSAGSRSADNPWFMNACNQNIYIKEAGNGIGGKAEDAQTPALVEAGAFVTREVFPGMPHHFAPQRSYAMFIPQLIQQPIPINAPEVKFYTDNLRYNQAYWITIDQLIEHNADSTVHAVYDDGQPEPPRPGSAAATRPQASAPVGKPSITIKTTNISGMTLKLAGAVVPDGAAMPVVIDGQTVLEGRIPEVAHVARTDGNWALVEKPALTGKRHGMQGPLWDAFTTPFLGVYGEGPGARELAIAELDAVRAKGTFHGDFPIKSAAKLTPEDVQNYSLILFGGPEVNSVVKRIADRLPQSLLENSHDGDNGVVMIQPNPENPERYVVVWSAKLLSRSTSPLAESAPSERRNGASIRSLQDYVVLRDGQLAKAGFFYANWELD